MLNILTLLLSSQKARKNEKIFRILEMENQNLNSYIGLKYTYQKSKNMNGFSERERIVY